MGTINLIGNTPLVQIEEYKGVKIYAKLEYFNPTGSVKDRAALYIVRQAEKEGLLKKGGTIIEGTSGNTGIGLAFVASQLGYKCIIVMPSSMSAERQVIMRAFGAELVLTGEGGMKKAVEYAAELHEQIKNSILASQFSNKANPLAHYKTTGPEILKDLPDVDVIISPFGTGGTAVGLKMFFSENKDSVKIIGVEPEESPLITKGIACSHRIQGIGANFVPEIMKMKQLDDILTIGSDESYDGARELVKKFGIMSGLSGGCAYKAAKKYIDKNCDVNNVVIMIPDTSLRYLSTGIYG